MLPDDQIRLKHIVDAAREAIGFATSRTIDDLSNNRMLLLSLIKELEIIGEAANKVTEDSRKLFPSVPWEDIVGMRNHLIHGYFDVDVTLVWDTVT